MKKRMRMAKSYQVGEKGRESHQGREPMREPKRLKASRLGEREREMVKRGKGRSVKGENEEEDLEQTKGVRERKMERMKEKN